MTENISVGDACAEADVPLHELISWMHRSGALLLVPGSGDPRCWLVSGFERHGQDCECRFIPAHPDIQPI
jgi:hypothetical protein